MKAPSSTPLEEALARRQRAFYAAAGADAFGGTVPFRLSTSRAMARLVAQAAQRFAATQRRARVRVVDVGAGAGRLAFHLLEAVPDGSLRVTLTDASEAMVASWHAHPQLGGLFEAGLLQAHREAATGLDAALAHDADEALVLLGTYLLDTLPHALLEAPGRKAFVDDAGALHFQKAALDPFARATLARLRHGRVFMPTGAFDFVAAVERRLDGPALLLVADKGSQSLEAAREGERLRLVSHGAGASVSVNFDALRAWLGWRGWAAAPAPGSDFVVGASVLRGRAPLGDLFGGVAHPLEVQARVTALRDEGGDALARGLLALAPDGDVVLELADALCAAPPESAALRQRVGDWLLTAVRGAFFLQQDDVAFHAGRALHRSGFLAGAAACFSHSLEHHGEVASARFNRALCLAELGALDDAREDLALVLAREPQHAQALALLAQLR